MATAGLATDSLVIALTKGRILDLTLRIFARIGLAPLESIGASRKLVFDTSRPGVRFMVLRGVDVPTYVEHGIVDLGVSGKDVLMEHGGNGFYEPLDLGIGRCRLMTAGLADEPPLPPRIKVATKFVNIARDWYAERGVQVDIIKLYGAMELGPVTGLAHRIVDIVETGNTLKANGLVERELVADVSTRLIVNRASMKRKHRVVQPLLDEIAAAVEQGNE